MSAPCLICPGLNRGQIDPESRMKWRQAKLIRANPQPVGILLHMSTTVTRPQIGANGEAIAGEVVSPAVPWFMQSLSTGPAEANASAMSRLHLHLLSDSTGETLEMIAKAALAQFDDADVIRHFWPMVRSQQHLDRILADIAANPGLVLFTLVNP